MQVKIKKLVESAIVPKYATEGAACLDLTAVSKSFDEYGNLVYGTGLAFEIPEGYVGLIYPRSSLSKYDMALTNCVGVIDSDYRGEVTFKFCVATKVDVGRKAEPQLYDIGDRIGQIMIVPYPKIEFVETDELSDTRRGSNGYGSTGQGRIQ
jgi:dUTP pyrophosphatase